MVKLFRGERGKDYYSVAMPLKKLIFHLQPSCFLCFAVMKFCDQTELSLEGERFDPADNPKS